MKQVSGAAEFFKDKTIFIGSSAYLSDRVNTPRGHMSGTYLLALISESMRHGMVLKEATFLFDNMILLFILTILFVLLLINVQGFKYWLSQTAILAVILIIHLYLLFLQQQSNLLFYLELFAFTLLINLLYVQFVVKKQNRHLQNENIELTSAAFTDQLTGIYNRRAFIQSCDKEFDRVSRHQCKKPSVAIMDLDKFKSVNDTYGHDIGDDVLKIFSSVLSEQVRNIDTVARWGGEEFVVLLPETSAEQAKVVLERVRLEIPKKKIAGAEPLVVTVSIGITEIVDLSSSVDGAIKLADNALYEAKETGRNKICIAKN
ncbi:MAG: diguanylate cyclase [Gammaproteobacteria bacterium]|nr:diguanylate cyclase [Gammaproteobacteria bacterium]